MQQVADHDGIIGFCSLLHCEDDSFRDNVIDVVEQLAKHGTALILVHNTC